VSDDAPWPSRDQLATWMHVAGVIMTLPPAIDAQLKRYSGLSFYEYSILDALSRAPNRARQLCELAQMAYGSQSRLSHAMKRMEKQGWVMRRDCAGHARGVEAVLTDEGHAKLIEAAPGHVQEVRRLVVDALTPEQLAQFGEICRSLLAVTAPNATHLLEEGLSPPND
jgi:DNA-binding MarR family transcriptional regulator